MTGPDGHLPSTTNGRVPTGADLPGIDGAQRLALLVGLIGLAACGALSLFNGGVDSFFRAYFYGYLFCLALPIASIGLLWINHMAPGTWGLIIRRPLEAGTATIILMAILFLPLIAGLESLYPWARDQAHAASPAESAAPSAPAAAEEHDAAQATEEAVEGHAAAHPGHEMHSRLGHKTWWFGRPFFLARAVLYFVVWFGMAAVLIGTSRRQDGTADPAPSHRLRFLGPFGLILLFLTATFALFDWSMSLDPNWYSTIYGAMLLIGMAQATLAFTIILVSRMVDRGLLGDLVTTVRLRDLGNLLLALTMLWAYTSFSQFLIMWSGNLAEEATWYFKRSHDGWQFVVGFLLVLGFFGPFIALLFRPNKQSTQRIRTICWLILGIHVVDVMWLVGPDLGFRAIRLSYLLIPVQFLAALAGIGGFLLFTYVFFLKGRPLLSVNDPAMVELVESDRAHHLHAQAHAHGHHA